MARSRVNTVLVSLLSFRPHAVRNSLNFRRGRVSSLAATSLCTIAGRKCLASSWSLSRLLPLVQSRTRSVLPWSDVGPYNAVRVRLEGEWEDDEDFRKSLRGERRVITTVHYEGKNVVLMLTFSAHVKQWRSEGKSAVWLHVSLSLGSLLTVAQSEGFSLHHAKEGEVILSLWLDSSRENKIPNFASHQVGACGK